MGTIYIATNLLNQKQYVGQTIRPLKDRINQHKFAKSNNYFDNALRKYGIENFKIFGFDCSFELLNDYECFWIRELNTLCPNGYNLTSGGEGGFIRSDFTCQKISESRKGLRRTEESRKKQSVSVSGRKNHFFGKTHTEDVKKIIKEKRKLQVISDESRKKMSLSRLGEKNPMFGRRGKNNPNFGREPWNKGLPQTEETKKKIAESVKGRRHNSNSIKKMVTVAKNRWANMSQEQRKKIGEKISQTKKEKFLKNKQEV